MMVLEVDMSSHPGGAKPANFLDVSQGVDGQSRATKRAS